MKEFLYNLIRKHKYEISIYTAEIFERRCQEEIIRSDEDNSSFVYLEFDFESLHKLIPDENNYNLFWDITLAALNKGRRISDIVGFLENDTGIGMLLLDSKLEGWNRVKGRILQMANVQSFPDMDKIISGTVKPILYPTCIQNMTQASISV